jgi:DNA-binding Xre family transcriptional regulator
MQNWKDLIEELKIIMAQNRIRQKELSKRTGINPSNISRMFTLKFMPNMGTFLKLCNALDYELKLHEIKDINLDLCNNCDNTFGDICSCKSDFE